MTEVTIYTRPFCPYCSRALALLRNKSGIKLQEIAAGFSPARRAEMIRRSNGGYTYPQIFVGDTHIGGCDDMVALESAGKLDPMLANGG